MSIGPNIKKEAVFKEKITTKISRSVKQTVENYFIDPLDYMFHLTLFGIIVSLLFHVKVVWQLYILLIILMFFSLKSEDGTKNKNDSKS